ncbi:hypothetical protein QQ213_003553 [Vibrio vulnificus]|nr:hypothetical protein [Vibrio vulnificus]
MFTIETDNLKIEYAPRANRKFVVTHEYATIRCDSISVEDEIMVNLLIDDEDIACVQVLEEEAKRIKGYASMMTFCETREIGGKTVSYAPMWELVIIDEDEGSFEYCDGEFLFHCKGTEIEPRKLKISETDGFAIMGFISMLDKKRKDYIGE